MQSWKVKLNRFLIKRSKERRVCERKGRFFLQMYSLHHLRADLIHIQINNNLWLIPFGCSVWVGGWVDGWMDEWVLWSHDPDIPNDSSFNKSSPSPSSSLSPSSSHSTVNCVPIVPQNSSSTHPLRWLLTTVMMIVTIYYYNDYDRHLIQKSLELSFK